MAGSCRYRLRSDRLRCVGDAMSARSFSFVGGEIVETWLGHHHRLSRWFDAPGTLNYDGTLTDEQRQQLADTITEYDQSEQKVA
jgi:hypothetical protein